MEVNYILVLVALALIFAIYLGYKYSSQFRELVSRIAVSGYKEFKDELYDTILLLCPDEYDPIAETLIEIVDEAYELCIDMNHQPSKDLIIQYVEEALKDLSFELKEEEMKIVNNVANIIIGYVLK